jgi:hypothetical protein
MVEKAGRPFSLPQPRHIRSNPIPPASEGVNRDTALESQSRDLREPRGTHGKQTL